MTHLRQPIRTALSLSAAVLIMASGLSVAAYANPQVQTAAVVAASEAPVKAGKKAKKVKTKKAKAPELVDTKPENATLPGSQFRLEVSTTRDVMPFRARVDGLSDNQRQALDKVAGQAGWAQDNPITLELYTSHAPQSINAAENMRAYLLNHGVADEDILISHRGEVPDDIVSLNVVTFAMKPIACGQRWDDLARTFTNRPDNNFGCSVNANLAAMINDPRHVVSPAQATPVDVNRRNVIMQKYRAGQVTSSAVNDAASARISSAVK